MAEFRMPSLGADMEAGILVEWRVRSGDRVKRGDIIAEVETDKGLIEIEVFEDGVVDQLLIEPGKKLPVGTVLATILGEGAQPAAPLTPMVPPRTIERARISEMPRAEIAAPPGPKRVRASPKNLASISPRCKGRGRAAQSIVRTSSAPRPRGRPRPWQGVYLSCLSGCVEP